MRVVKEGRKREERGRIFSAQAKAEVGCAMGETVGREERQSMGARQGEFEEVVKNRNRERPGLR